MLDSDLIVAEPGSVAERLALKGSDPDLVRVAREAILCRRAARSNLDQLRGQMNVASREMSTFVRDGGPVEERRAQLSDLKAKIARAEASVREAEAIERRALLVLPNLPDPRSPEGTDESANCVLYERGPKPVPKRGARPHWDIGKDLGLLDPERAAKLSGSGFAVLRGAGARLLRALVQFGLDLHRDTYEELVVPHVVRSEVMVGTGHLPKFRDDAYTVMSDDLWLIPTGEVPLTGLHRDEMLPEDDLPLRYMAHTACFRREAGSAGKDTRGMQRVHEFHKVEMVRICRPQDAEREFCSLLEDAERALQQLRLPYRAVELATGDLTFSSSRVIDLEVYSPGIDRWLEVSSIGNFTDFQARRSNIRYKRADGKVEHPFTLNGSALATPRVWAAIIEHGLQSDGSVRLPEVLHPYMGASSIMPG